MAVLMDQMRMERIKRWKEALPRVWAKTPGRIYSWLRAERATWGTTPLTAEDGSQLVTHKSVDSAVKDFWVKKIWQRDDPTKAAQSWTSMLCSPFRSHITSLKGNWRLPEWTEDFVVEVLRSMKKNASPGMWGIPIWVWLALPSIWHVVTAKVIQWVQDHGEWPEEALDAYVVLLPKGQGTEVQNQRPITVLELLYRIYARGVVMTWRDELQKSFLGAQAMGFRASTSTRHLAQFIQDLIALRNKEGGEIWLVKFDVKKCYDSIPWWALWGIMRCAGIPEKTVKAFKNFYERLRRRFRYGKVDGAPWQGTNGLAQGCPAAPHVEHSI